MSTVLVVYATKSGCTKAYAEAIGEGLTEAGVVATVVDAQEKPDPTGYDAILVGSGIRAGMWHASAKQWLVGHAQQLKSVPCALFMACLTTATAPEKADEVRAYADLLLTETGIEPVDIGMFPGWYMPQSFSLPERLVLKAMKTPEGDFRDLDSARAWARELAPRLGGSA